MDGMDGKLNGWKIEKSIQNHHISPALARKFNIIKQVLKNEIYQYQK